MQDAVILAAVRSPVGRLRGALSGIRPDDLLAEVIREAVRRAACAPEEVDEVIAGCANQAGEDNRNVARMAALLADLPYDVPALTVNRLCASGLDAVLQAVRSVWVGDHRVVIAGGVESMSRAPLVMAKGDRPFASGNRTAYDTALGWRFPNPRLAARFELEAMGETAENLAERFNVSREAQDAWALRSHRWALAAQECGAFTSEILPITAPVGKAMQVIDKDEGPRADTNLEKLAVLRPAFRPGGTVTAGNASTLNDGAAAVVVTTPEVARSWGVRPLARVRAGANAGVDPRVMGLGPVPATLKALGRAGLALEDIDLVEINEAFAVQVLCVMQQLGLDPERVNIHGGAIALGHPLGCSGARILTTLLHAMAGRGATLGLATLCVGVGQGTSLVVERL